MKTWSEARGSKHVPGAACRVPRPVAVTKSAKIRGPGPCHACVRAADAGERGVLPGAGGALRARALADCSVQPPRIKKVDAGGFWLRPRAWCRATSSSRSTASQGSRTFRSSSSWGKSADGSTWSSCLPAWPRRSRRGRCSRGVGCVHTREICTAARLQASSHSPPAPAAHTKKRVCNEKKYPPCKK